MHATTYQGVHVKMSYIHAPYMDKEVQVLLHYQNGPTTKTDSFLLSYKGLDQIVTHVWADNFVIDVFWVELRRKNGILLQKYMAGGTLYAQPCSGFNSTNPFGGDACVSFTDSGVGTICGSVDAYFQQDFPVENIRNSDGHFSRPFEIYCRYDQYNFEAPLKLSLPCGLGWQQKGERCLWYESKDGMKTWTAVDTGIVFYPAKGSYHGGVFYGERVYYKVKVENSNVSNKVDVFSNPIGPVRFFLGWHLDSIRQTGKTCADIKNVTVYFQDSDFNANGVVPRFWVFYKHPDSTKEYRYQLLNVGRSPLALANKNWLNMSVTPNTIVQLPLNRGQYRFMYDFTPWNGFTCKLFFDTFILKDDFVGDFKADIKQIEFLKCFGDKNASIEIKSSGTDTSKRYYSRDSINWHALPDTLKNTAGGKYTFWVKNNLNCVVSNVIEIKEPAKFYTAIKLDTTLCIGQNLFLNIHDPKAQSYQIKGDAGIISTKDTITLKNAGKYVLTVKDSLACMHTDTISLVRKNLTILHDFLVPTKAFLTDSVFAVDVSKPAADKSEWKYSDNRIVSSILKATTNKMRYPDTGTFTIKLNNRYAGCGYTLSKNITIVGKNDSAGIKTKYGYTGPLIQKFEIDPNPNDGQNFKIKVTLRDTANIVIYKIDPISGDIVGDIDYYKKKYYEITAFKSQTESIFFLKLVAGNESKTIKVVVIP